MVKCEQKRILLLLVITIFVCFTIQPYVSASDEPLASHIKPGPMPRSMYINWTSTRLTIPSTGSAEATGQITGIPGVTTRVAIFLYLEIYVNSTWSVVASENQTYDSYLGSLQADFPVSSGYSYRIRASYYAFCDSASENLVRYSNIVYH